MAQSDNVQFHIGHPEWAASRHSMRAQVKHRIELVRHGESECNIRLTTEGKVHPTPDPALTDRGRQQTADIGRFYNRMLGLSLLSECTPTIHFQVSPLQRALDTAAPTLAVYKEYPGDIIVDVALRERWRHEGTALHQRRAHTLHARSSVRR